MLARSEWLSDAERQFCRRVSTRPPTAMLTGEQVARLDRLRNRAASINVGLSQLADALEIGPDWGDAEQALDMCFRAAYGSPNDEEVAQ
jgi:hypothetical protein